MGTLFPHLPDQIGLECLLRVQFNSLHKLIHVCKSWNALLKSPQFYQERKRLQLSKQRICIISEINGICDRVMVYDLEENSCETLTPIPPQITSICCCHFVKQKLVLITNMLPDRTMNVWLYDFVCSQWQQGAQMPGWWDRFASAADENRGLVYVGGGRNRIGNPLLKASVYSVEEDKWDPLPDMGSYLEDSRGAFADGKFYVMGLPSCPTFEVYDPCRRSWKTMENRFNSMYFVSAFGHLYCFSRRELIDYDCSQDKLSIAGPLKYHCRQSKLSIAGPFPNLDWYYLIESVVVVGHNIFVSRWGREAFYVLDPPPSQRGGAFKWIPIESPSGLQGFITCAVTVDI